MHFLPQCCGNATVGEQIDDGGFGRVSQTTERALQLGADAVGAQARLVILEGLSSRMAEALFIGGSLGSEKHLLMAIVKGSAAAFRSGRFSGFG